MSFEKFRKLATAAKTVRKHYTFRTGICGKIYRLGVRTEINSPTQSNHSTSIQLQITSDPQQLPVVRDTGEQLSLQAGFSKEIAGKIVLALDEALSNVIKHGYGGAKDKPIHINMDLIRRDEKTGLRIVICDEGKKVSPTEIKGRDLDDIRPGGLGVFLIRSIMDIVEYSPSDVGMKLEMIKFLSE